MNHLKSALGKAHQGHWIDPNNREKAFTHLWRHYHEYLTIQCPFKTIEEIKAVEGIGEETFQAIKFYIACK